MNMDAQNGGTSGLSLKRKTLNSTIWNFVRIGYTNLSQFLFFVLIARMLSPENFGAFSVAAVVYQIVRMLAGAGLGENIVRAPEADRQLLDTVFWGSVTLSSLGALVLALLAIPYGALLRAPEVVPILQALAGLMVVGSLSVVHLSLKLRDFGHKSLALRTVITSSLGGVAGVAAAYYGFGTWSLFIQVAVAEVLGLFFWWTAVRWYPTFNVSLQRLWPMLGFGIGVTMTQISWMLLVRVQDIVITRFLGLADAANYRVAWRLIDTIVQMSFSPIGGVTNITLAKLQSDRPAFQRAYLRLQGLASLLTLPAIAGFAALGPEIIVMIFGHKWDAAGPTAQVLGWLAFPFCLNFLVGPALQALGQSKAMSSIAFIQLALTTVFSLIGAQFGLEYVAWAYVLRAYLTLPLQLNILKKFTGLTPYAVIKELLYPTVASAVMVIVLLLLKRQIDGGTLETIFMIAVGAIVYGLVMLVFARGWLASHLNSLKGAVRK